MIGSRPDGWWRDRRGAMRRLTAALDRYAQATGDELTVVFDGRPFELPAEHVQVLFAPVADELIVERIRGGAATALVTSDRELAERARNLGAEVIGAGEFRQRLDSA